MNEWARAAVCVAPRMVPGLPLTGEQLARALRAHGAQEASGMSPCEWLKIGDGTVVHINRGRGGRKQVCKFCGQKYSEGKLCDFPVDNGKTCDAAMCNNCARTLGYQDTEIGAGIKRMGDTVDICPIHRGQPFPKASA